MGVFDDLGELAENVVNAIGEAPGDLVQAAGHMFEDGGLLVGVAVAGGAFFLVGPGFVIPAFLGGSIAAGALIRQRPLEPAERAFAERVLGTGNLPPNDQIILTNFLGAGGSAFVVPNPAGKVLVNLGDGGYRNPLEHFTNVYPTKGQLFIHEMTHVMQYHRAEFKAGLMCEGAFNQIDGGNYEPAEEGCHGADITWSSRQQSSMSGSPRTDTGGV